MSHLSSFLDIASAEDPWLHRAAPAPKPAPKAVPKSAPAPGAAKGKHVAHRLPQPPRRPPSPPPLPPHELKLLIEEILYAQQLEEDFAFQEALALQQQYQQEDEEFLKLQSELLVKDLEWEEELASLGTKQRTGLPRNRTFDCGICLEAMPIGVSVGVEGCDHELCEECMKEYVTTKIQERKYPITCPLCQVAEGEEVREEGVIVEELIQSLGLSDETILIYDELQLLPFAVQVDCRRSSRRFILRCTKEY
ncbi:hypothetical protein AX16_010369 [Volvariella volvacea WC 439]|nr:hypothetical protein AX16_010369 [Volvariella volvacea WC 439]